MGGFAFTRVPIDPAAARPALDDPAAGGYTSFEGWVRNHNEGRAVLRLEYEAYESLGVKEGERILAEAHARFPILKAACVHRIGRLEIGEMAVWVDEVKDRVPIWKKEHYAAGDSGWINCAVRAPAGTPSAGP